MSALTINSKKKLNSGYEIPLLGYGVYLTPAEDCAEAVGRAFKAGYRHVDSAAVYKNEKPCGQAIRESGLPREEVFFTSKIQPKELGYEKTVKQIETTLEVTGLKYIDLMLIHAPYGGSAQRKGAWKALVEAQEAGKIRSLGVSNYGVHHLEELEKHIKELEEERGGQGKGGVLSVNQVELHPWLCREDIAKWCRDRNVAVEAFCPIVRNKKANDKTLNELSNKYGKTTTQVLLRWSLQKGYVPLPKSVTPSRIIENADLYDFELSKDDVEKLATNAYEHLSWDPTVEPLDK